MTPRITKNNVDTGMLARNIIVFKNAYRSIIDFRPCNRIVFEYVYYFSSIMIKSKDIKTTLQITNCLMAYGLKKMSIVKSRSTP